VRLVTAYGDSGVECNLALLTECIRVMTVDDKIGLYLITQIVIKYYLLGPITYCKLVNCVRSG